MADKVITIDPQETDELFSHNRILELDEARNGREPPLVYFEGPFYARFYSTSLSAIQSALSSHGELTIINDAIAVNKTESIVFDGNIQDTLTYYPHGNLSWSWNGKVYYEDGSPVYNPQNMNVMFVEHGIVLPRGVVGTLNVSYYTTYALLEQPKRSGYIQNSVIQDDVTTTLNYDVKLVGGGSLSDPDDSNDSDDPDDPDAPDDPLTEPTLCCQNADRTSPTLTSPIEMSPGLHKAVVAMGGCAPFSFSVTGTGLTVSNAGGSNVAALVASDDACGSGELTVTDACNQTATAIVNVSQECCSDAMTADECGSIERGETKVISVSGGDPPYNWAAYGSGVTVGEAQTDIPHNTLQADGEACGTADGYAKVGVTDACDNQATILCQLDACCDTVEDVSWAPSNPDVMNQGECEMVAVEGGIGPFFWQVSDNGYIQETGTGNFGTSERAITVCAKNDACGSITVSCLDTACGSSVEQGLRIADADGKWCNIEASECDGGHYYVWGNYYDHWHSIKTGKYMYAQEEFYIENSENAATVCADKLYAECSRLLHLCPAHTAQYYFCGTTKDRTYEWVCDSVSPCTAPLPDVDPDECPGE
jgi:hypothetical protein